MGIILFSEVTPCEDHVSTILLSNKAPTNIIRVAQAVFKASACGLTPKTHLRSPITPPGGVLGISSDGDDRMEPKVKTQKNP